MAQSKSPGAATPVSAGTRRETPLTSAQTRRRQQIMTQPCRPPKHQPVVNGPDHPKTRRKQAAQAQASQKSTTEDRRKTPVTAAQVNSPSRGERRQARQEAEQKKQEKSRRRQQRKLQAQQAQRAAEEAQAQRQAQEKMETMPVVNGRAAGIDVGDATHWVCVEQTPDEAPRVREFSAMSHGLRELIAWLKECGITTVALEATGIYSHILFLSLLEAGFDTKLVPPQFTRQIQGRPKTDKRDCEWIQRLHKLGLLPGAFQPNEATQTLRDYVRQRSNHVRLSSHHILRMQKALELMNLKLTKVLGDITGVTGLSIIRAILKGERDPVQLAQLRDRRCKHDEDEIAQALDGRYRPEHLLELKLCFHM